MAHGLRHEPAAILFAAVEVSDDFVRESYGHAL
jgi:hypothetical protein